SSYVESLPDFPKLMEAYGHVGIQIDHADELESKLAEAMAINDKCVFINVMVDRSEHVYPMLVAGQSMQDMWLSKGERSEERRVGKACGSAWERKSDKYGIRC